MQSDTCWAVIPAAGLGRRMGNQVPKQYLRLGDRAVIENTLLRFTDHPAITGIVVAVDPQDHTWSSLAIDNTGSLITVPGGRERCHSVLNALRYLMDTARAEDWVLVHDAVRPCLTRQDLDLLIAALRYDAVGGILATPVRDTLKRANRDGRIAETVDRTGLWHALTPQMFRLEVLYSALQAALARGDDVTDEASAVERTGLKPRLIEGRGDNIKITRPEDLALAERILAAQSVNSHR